MSIANLDFLYAAKTRNLGLLKDSLTEGADIRTKNPYSETNALHLAVSRGASNISGNQEEVVSYLTQTDSSKTADLINGTDINGNTPLLILLGTTKVSEKIFNLLSSAGAKFDHANKSGLNSLHLLAQNPENVSFLKFALDRLTEIDELAKPLLGKTIVKATEECIIAPLAQLIASYAFEGQKTKALNCQANHFFLMHDLTPLHLAIFFENKEAVALLRVGTDLSLKKKNEKKTLEDELKEFDETTHRLT
jgi:ankyrin repeat protein